MKERPRSRDMCTTHKILIGGFKFKANFSPKGFLYLMLRRRSLPIRHIVKTINRCIQSKIGLSAIMHDFWRQRILLRYGILMRISCVLITPISQVHTHFWNYAMAIVQYHRLYVCCRGNAVFDEEISS